MTPISIARPNLPESPVTLALPGEHPASLRGRVGQGVDAIAGSANKVISGVVDSSFGVLRALLPGQTAPMGTGSANRNGTSAGQRSVLSLTSGPGSTGTGTGTGTGVSAGCGGAGESDTALWGVRPSLGLLRRETGFSIAGLTVALPGGHSRTRSQSHPEEGQRELVEVSSRPPSLGSHRDARGDEESGETESSSEEEAGTGGSEDEKGVEGKEDREAEGEGEGEAEAEEEAEEEVHDTRSIKSFESMLSSGRTKPKTRGVTSSGSASSRGRKRLTDLTDRLTHGMAGMSRRVQSGDNAHKETTWAGRVLPPPNRRFVECTDQDIRVSEVGELLREYQQLVEAIRNTGGFQE